MCFREASWSRVEARTQWGTQRRIDTRNGRVLLKSPSEGELMEKLQGLMSIVSELRVERTNLVNQLQHVDAALSVLSRLNGGSSLTEPRRTLSATSRRKMRLAQKARRAKENGRTFTAQTKKRTMSASARRKIAAAQRARWAKVKAGKKAA
jgi:hypothetical protein